MNGATSGVRKPNSRSSVLPSQSTPAASSGWSPGLPKLDSGSGAAAPEAIHFMDLFHEEQSVLSVAGVIHMIFLERKMCLLSAHTDRILRLWSTKEPGFSHRLELVMPLPLSTQGSEQEHEQPSRSPKTTEPAAKTDHQSASSSQVAPLLRKGASDRSTGMRYVVEVQDVKTNANMARITALYGDGEGNRLFIGDYDGYVRIYDISGLPHQRQLPRLQIFQPHRQSVLHLEQFELDGQVVVMSASSDGTIAMCTFEGERIGTFSSNGPHWGLADPSTWNTTMPVLDDGPRVVEEEDGWGMSPRRAGKGAGRQHHGRSAGATPGMSGALSGPGSGRNARPGQPRARQATTSQTHCGQGIFKSLSAFEKHPPEVGTIEEGEKAYLEKHFKHKSRLLEQ